VAAEGKSELACEAMPSDGVLRKFVPSANLPSWLDTESSSFRAAPRLRLVSYNILNGALGTRERHGPVEEEVRTWSARREVIVKELRGYLADVVVLQEVSASMALDLDASLRDLGYRLMRPTENLGEEEALDLPEGKYEAHAPATFVRESEHLQVVDWHVFKLCDAAPPLIDHGGKDEGTQLLLGQYVKVCRDARAIVTKLRCTGHSGKDSDMDSVEVIVGNVHLHHNPVEPHIKTLQIASIVRHLQTTISKVVRQSGEGKNGELEEPQPDACSSSSAHIVLAGDFNSVVRKTRPDAFDQPRAGCWDGVSALSSGVYELCSSGSLSTNHPDHPVNRVANLSEMSKMRSPVSLGMSFTSAYKLATGKEPCVTTKCFDFAATLDYIFVPTSAVQSDRMSVVNTLALPYEDTDESDTWLGQAAVASVIPELGVSIPNKNFPSDHLAIGCDIAFFPSCRLSKSKFVSKDSRFLTNNYFPLPFRLEATRTKILMKRISFASFYAQTALILSLGVLLGVSTKRHSKNTFRID